MKEGIGTDLSSGKGDSTSSQTEDRLTGKELRLVAKQSRPGGSRSDLNTNFSLEVTGAVTRTSHRKAASLLVAQVRWELDGVCLVDDEVFARDAIYRSSQASTKSPR